MTEPLVSCLMPTADRRGCVPLAVDTFLRQDYAARELVILDDGTEPIADLLPRDPRIRYYRAVGGCTLGEKRNETCRLAHGDIFVHWDDDDWSAPWRLSYQVRELQSRAADVCGLNTVWFYDPRRDLAWLYQYPNRLAWLAGSTLCYWRRMWERRPFPDMAEGEDTVWITAAIDARVLPLPNADFFVARVHDRNTSPKQTNGLWWTPRDPAHVRTLLGRDLSRFGVDRPSSLPLASCVLATGGRRAFFSLTLERYLAQDYPRKELVVVDEGDDGGVEDLARQLPDTQYVRVRGRQSLAAKRNIGCRLAKGDVLVQWDDDDWYGDTRLSTQVDPLAEGRADVTGLEARWIADLRSGEFWAVSPQLHRRMFFCDVHTGTLAFTRAVWTAGARYPEDVWPEDSAFLSAALGHGQRLLRISNDELFVYMRHHTNAWTFPPGSHLDPRGWGHVSAPRALSSATFERYRRAAGTA